MANIELTDHIRDKVREALMTSLTPEQLDQFVKAEIDSLFKPRRTGYNDLPSLFNEMVKAELETLVKLEVKKWLAENFESAWTDRGSERLVGEAVKQFVPIVIESLASGLISQALVEIRNRL